MIDVPVRWPGLTDGNEYLRAKQSRLFAADPVPTSAVQTSQKGRRQAPATTPSPKEDICENCRNLIPEGEVKVVHGSHLCKDCAELAI